MGDTLVFFVDLVHTKTVVVSHMTCFFVIVKSHIVLPARFALKWLEADVVEAAEDGRARVHLKGYAKKFHVWVSPHGGRVRQYGPHRVAAKGGNRSSARQASLAPGQQHVRQIAQLSSR